MTIRFALAAALVFAPLTAHAQSGDTKVAQELSLEQRVQRIEDEKAIQRLIMEYAIRLDARDFDGYAALFARDGVWQNGPTIKHGRAEIRAMLDGIYGEQDPGYENTESYRIVHNVVIDLDGDHATARSRQLTIMRGDRGSPTPRLSGIYEDEFIREDGEWKFLKRTDSVFMPSGAEWMKQMQELRAEQAAAASD